tara:strand:- start:106 stop:777 length:672 start_codon:yes stop_codon:yes gene_type:complete
MKINCNNISKSYFNTNSKSNNIVINNTSLSVESGDSVTITGPSGVGKSTLLNIISGLDNPDKGEIFFDDLCFSSLSSSQKTQFRLQNISLVFQSNNLLKDFNVNENIILPLMYKGLSKKQARKIASESLEHVNMTNHEASSISTLSGGEAQRVGIARAIAMQSKIILADEPTGNLDNESSSSILSYLTRICLEKNITLIVVTHDNNILGLLKNMKKLIDGKII